MLRSLEVTPIYYLLTVAVSVVTAFVVGSEAGILLHERFSALLEVLQR